MLSSDGITPHLSANFYSGAALVSAIAAPAAGTEILVFGVFLTSGTSLAQITFQDGAALRLLPMKPQLGVPVWLHDPCGIFRVGDNLALDISNPGTAFIQGLITYEIRPSGV